MWSLSAFAAYFLPAAYRPALPAPSSSSSSSSTAAFGPASTGRLPGPSPRRAASAPRMLFNLFSRRDTVALPQHDVANRAARAAAVAAMRETYEWKYEGIADAALVKQLPLPEEAPDAGWIAGLAQILVRVALNGVAEDVDDAVEDSVVLAVGRSVAAITSKVLTGQTTADDMYAIIDEIKGLYKGNATGIGHSLDDYKDLFNTIKLDTVAKHDQFLRDDIFGWYRVAGPNPMKLTRLSGAVADMFPDITDELLRGVPAFADDSLEEAARENRLYYVDYKELDGIPTGKIDGEQKDLYVYAPRCLLAVPKNVTARMTVLPIAIHCGQGPSYPMFTANKTHTDPVTWIAAKFTVQSADSLVHETVYHLGRCHLLEEVMLVSTYRSLADTHPLHRLLKPSFYGTALINAAAVATLINPGGIIDRITAPDIATTSALSAASVNDPSFNFNAWMPDRELAARDVLHDALNFPYRDDALAHWAALTAFVGRFVDAYYASDADVADDYELQHFCEEVTLHGRIHGFGETADGAIVTKAYLVRMVAMVMFTASVQHAAVNFPQATLMQFAPAMPLGGAEPAPTTARPFDSVADWVDRMVPPLAQAETQLQTAETIGVLRYGMIGEYGKTLDFAPDAVADALAQYQEELGALGARIQERNKTERSNGLPVYNYQIPKNVPLSVNI